MRKRRSLQSGINIKKENCASKRCLLFARGPVIPCMYTPIGREVPDILPTDIIRSAPAYFSSIQSQHSEVGLRPPGSFPNLDRLTTTRSLDTTGREFGEYPRRCRYRSLDSLTLRSKRCLLRPVLVVTLHAHTLLLL